MSKIIHDLGTIAELTDSRRTALRRISELGLGAAIATIPFFKPGAVKAQSMNTDIDILNYALTLEYIERSFYNQAIAAGHRPADADGLFMEIAENEDAHVELLRAAIIGPDEDNPLGIPVEFDDEDFVFDGFLDDAVSVATLAQGLEDTGVRAYKGQAAAIESKAILTVALQIHSVEARHAAAIRRLPESPAMKGWIPGDQDNADGSPIAATYAGEDNTTQGGVELVGALGGAYTAQEITEAFDETLSMTEVLAIADPFLP